MRSTPSSIRRSSIDSKATRIICARYLLNLLGNAIKFTERGEVNLTVTLKQETESAVTARFEVKDTGIGMTREALATIFERFVQADQSTTRKYGGTGLGTTIAKQLVELMGGNISVESVPGQRQHVLARAPAAARYRGCGNPFRGPGR